MSVNRHSILWGSILSGAGVMQIFGPPSFFPDWLNNAISLTAVVLIIAAVIMLVVSQLHQRTETNQNDIILGFNIGRWLTLIINYEVVILFCTSILAFFVGASISPSKPNTVVSDIPLQTTHLDNELMSQHTPDHPAIAKEPSSINIDKKVTTAPVEEVAASSPLPDQVNIDNTSHIPTRRIFTPRTPMELMDIAATETTRDAARYKGSWIHVEGTVLNISEIRNFPPVLGKKPYIEVEVEVGTSLNSSYPRRVQLYFDADSWKLQVDKIERGDSLVANGTVEHVHELFMFVINAEIISVSGPDRVRR